ncbi:MAG: hypothetical protein PF447_09575 [Spirochaetaceae bacterium]|jgi:hypothetical protein|nr:hypothetical protein [Spirochaetaceae bacterium]
MKKWEGWLASLNDKAFFELYRHYIGKVKTPYHKQDLMQDFISWIKADENQQAIVELLDSEEAALLCLIYYQQPITPLDLNALMLQNCDKLVLNLQERLLIFNLEGHIQINPYLKGILVEKDILHPQRILNIQEASLGHMGFTADDNFLTALLIFLNRDDRVFVNDNQLSKRIIQDFKKTFTHLITDIDESMLYPWIKGFLKLGLLDKKDDMLLLGSKKDLKTFSELSPLQRSWNIVLSLCPIDLQDISIQIIQWIITWDKGSFTLDDWKKMVIFFHPNARAEQLKQWEIFGKNLISLGFLKSRGQRLFPQVQWLKEKEEPTVPPLLQPNGDFHLTPQTPFCWILPYTTEITGLGSFLQCTVSRRSFERGCKYQLRADLWIKSLEDLTGSPLDSSFATLVKEWDKEFFAMDIFPTYLLSLSDSTAGLLRKSDSLAPYILRELGDNQWLMNWEQRDLWQEELHRLGLSFYPPDERHSQFTPLNMEQQRNHGKGVVLKVLEPLNPAKLMSLDHWQDNLDAAAYGELISRRDRKLILNNMTVNEELLKGEVRQARGLDYNAKIRLLETALQPPKERIILRLPGEELEPKELELDPIELIKKGAESILRALNLETDKEEEIAVRKMLLIQRFPKSLI